MKPWLIFILSLTFHPQAWTEELHEHGHEHQHQPNQSAELLLAEDIRVLLQQEMQALRTAMEALVFPVASGDWSEIERIGTGIANTFIMKQALTPEQMQRLHQELPEEFKLLDKPFHGYARKMAEAANARNMELVHFYRSRMNETCTACHTRFATARFPNLK